MNSIIEASVPSELLLLIFSFLTPIDITRCSRVCKLWNSLTNDTSLWKQLSSTKVYSPLIDRALSCLKEMDVRARKMELNLLKVNSFMNLTRKLKEDTKSKSESKLKQLKANKNNLLTASR
jgi:hypothetical protein